MPAFEAPRSGGFLRSVGGRWRGAGGNSSPIGGIEAGLAQVCPREDCGCRGREWLFAAERSDEAGCSGRRACADDWERVAPGRPMRGMAIGRGGAQAKSTEALGQLSGSKAGLWEGRAAVLKQRGETPGNCNVMRDGVVCRKMGGQDAEQVVGAGGGTEHEQEPCCLQAVNGGYALQQAVLLFAFRVELAGYEGVVSEGDPSTLSPWRCGGRDQSPTQTGSESAARSAMLGGSSPAAFQILVLPSCSRIRAWAQSAAARAS